MIREHELYADSAQARELDRDRHEAGPEITLGEEEENDRIWAAAIRAQEQSRKISSRRVLQIALAQMEERLGSSLRRMP